MAAPRPVGDGDRVRDGPMTDLQSRADHLAGDLARAIADLAASPDDGEMVAIVRISQNDSARDGGTIRSNLLWTWDWFWRPKTDKP
jgi:hypothetical protein